MANKELFELTDIGSPGLSGDMIMYLVDADGSPAGNSRKVTLDELKTFVNTDPTIVPSSEPFRGALMKRTTNQSVSNNAETAVTWESAAYDTDSFWSAGAPTRLTVPTGVTKVRVLGNARWTNNATGIRYLTFTKNGAAFDGRGMASLDDLANNFHNLNVVSAVVEVSAGDYFEMPVFQNSGAALNLLADTRTWFSIEVVEATI